MCWVRTASAPACRSGPMGHHVQHAVHVVGLSMYIECRMCWAHSGACAACGVWAASSTAAQGTNMGCAPGQPCALAPGLVWIGPGHLHVPVPVCQGCVTGCYMQTTPHADPLCCIQRKPWSKGSMCCTSCLVGLATHTALAIHTAWATYYM